MNIKNIFKKFRLALDNSANIDVLLERQLLLMGRMMANANSDKKHITSLEEVEFKIFSQWGDDGIIQYLVNNINFDNKTFIEFGVQDYRESNTRFLMMNNNWSGLVMDGSEENIDKIITSEYYWKYELLAKCLFIDKDNINDAIISCNFERDLGVLHIDIDGNDYWIWKEINVINPVVVIMEYNSVFGMDRAITIPYEKNFMRTQAHHSNLYFGASLPALCELSISKGYTFIGCNSAGNNAYFVRNDKISDAIPQPSLENGYVLSKPRESRDKNGQLNYLTGADRLEHIRGLAVYNVKTKEMESL